MELSCRVGGPRDIQPQAQEAWTPRKRGDPPGLRPTLSWENLTLTSAEVLRFWGTEDEDEAVAGSAAGLLFLGGRPRPLLTGAGSSSSTSIMSSGSFFGAG